MGQEFPPAVPPKLTVKTAHLAAQLSLCFLSNGRSPSEPTALFLRFSLPSKVHSAIPTPLRSHRPQLASMFVILLTHLSHQFVDSIILYVLYEFVKPFFQVSKQFLKIKNIIGRTLQNLAQCF